MKKYLLAGTMLAGLVIMAGCDETSEPAVTQNTPPANQRTATPPSVSPLPPAVVVTDGLDNPDGLKVGGAVGQMAPDIHGPDIDGEEFKLSDYRGQVVMLDFYGDW